MADNNLIQTAEVAVAGVASKSTYAGAGTSIFASWYLSNEFLGAVGVFIAVCGFLVNWHYKRQANLRAQEIHRLRKKHFGETGVDLADQDDE